MSSFQPSKGATVYETHNGPLILDREVGKGGEGSVWSIIGDPSVVAKFYYAGLQKDRARKIEAMCRLGSDSLLRIAAWPTAMLRTTVGGAPQGLLMPRITGYKEAHELYTPKSRRVNFPEAQMPFLLHACVNVARAFATVHEAGQVIGDVNHGNLLVSSEATVALIDCDSFEINDGKNFFPCLVGVPTYTPPELQGHGFQGVQRTKQHDAFGLAVLIFHLLFLGRHPFAGIFRQGTADKTIEDAIREYRFAYLPDNRLTEMEPPPAMPRLGEFPSDLGDLFIRSFNREGSAGHRPSAHEWIGPLESLSRNLKRCAANETHHYFQALSSCPWCRVEQAFGRPMFGIKLTLIDGTDFDLTAVWAQIEAIHPDEQSFTLPSTDAFRDQCQPDPRIPQIKEGRRVRRVLSASAILLAVAVVAPGVLPAVPSICLLIFGIVALVKLWQLARKVASPIETERRQAVMIFNRGIEHWNKLQRPPAAFFETKLRLKAEKQELSELPSVRARRLAALKAGLRQKQLTRFLEQHRLEDAAIPGIGPGRKTLLRCYNVEDASDVVISRLNIKGLGPSLKASLLAWRSLIESKFVFNPYADVDPADIKILDQELAQKRAALVRSLSTAPQKLRQVLLPWQVERSTLLSNLGPWAKRLAQAEVNMKALGRF